MWKKWKPFILSILLSVGVGTLAGFITKGSMAHYEAINKPALTPASVVFPIVWTILFILMGISAALIYKSANALKRPALLLYLLQLAFNFSWSIIFFNARSYGLAFFWLVLLWIMILSMILIFKHINKPAAYLQIPYLLWVTFAGYLNLMIWILNN